MAILVTSQVFPFLQITMLERSSIPQSTFISCNTAPKGIDILSIFEPAPVKKKIPDENWLFLIVDQQGKRFWQLFSLSLSPCHLTE